MMFICLLSVKEKSRIPQKELRFTLCLHVGTESSDLPAALS